MTERLRYSVCLQFKSFISGFKKNCTKLVLLLFPVAWACSGKLKVDTEMQLWEAGLRCLESRHRAVEFLYCASLPLGNVGAAGLLLPSWWVTASSEPQAVAALLLFPPEAADSVHGLAQTADTNPNALGSVETRTIHWLDGSGQGCILVPPCPAQGWFE